LDNISLHGAKGVLVNITGGNSLSISEFEEVGEVVKSLTAEDATVIVGTVIDNQMDDELRVTLVATGLEPNYANFNTGLNAGNTTGLHLNSNNLNRGVDVREHIARDPRDSREQFNQIAFNHTEQEVSKEKFNRKWDNMSVGSGLHGGSVNNTLEQNMDYLDIPAFLRKQSD